MARGEHRFPLVDQFQGMRLDADLSALAPGTRHVVETDKRLRRERSYGYVRALWWIWLEDGRSVASVPPGTGDAVRVIAAEAGRDALADPALAERLKRPVNAALERAGLEPVDRVWHDLSFACSAALLRRHGHGDLRRLTDESVPPADVIRLPTHCFPDGIVYGGIEGGRVVSCAFAHRTGVMEDRVADIGITTAEGYRRRGYAQTCVSAVVGEVTDRGGEARYGCSPDNEASKATARSVGFVPYAHSLVLAAPAPEG
jgi:ribosomal protein S18 acetylase RimI-like enzyme